MSEIAAIRPERDQGEPIREAGGFGCARMLSPSGFELAGP